MNENARTLRASLPRACKKTPCKQPESRTKSKPSSKQRPAEDLAAKGNTNVQIATDVCGRKTRGSLPRPAKKSQDQNSKDEQPEKPEKKQTNYQSSVAKHLVENDACALAHNDSSFRVVSIVCKSLTQGRTPLI